MVDSSFDNQVIFKLATIETQVKAISENLVAAVHRLEDKISETNQQQAAMITERKVHAGELERRIVALEAYRDRLAAKVAGIVSVIAVFWVLFGKMIESKVVSFF